MDGRILRGELNRQALVDAALALVIETGALPTAHEIARRAGVSKRSVFHHFPDMEGLLTVAADTQAARFWHILERPEPGLPLEERIGQAIDQRARLFDAISDVRRVAVRQEPGSPTLADRLCGSRRALRRHLRAWLNPELSDLPKAVGDGILAIGSWETWEVLRVDQGLTTSAAQRAVQATVESAFELVAT